MRAWVAHVRMSCPTCQIVVLRAPKRLAQVAQVGPTELYAVAGDGQLLSSAHGRPAVTSFPSP